MDDTVTALLKRIAEALERQCQQHDDWRALEAERRVRGISEHDKQREEDLRRRDDELAESKTQNEQLIAKLDESIATQAKMAALYESRNEAVTNG